MTVREYVRLGVVALAAVVGALVVADAAADPPRKAPELRAPAEDGREVTLSDLRGRVVLVDFWASWCVPCKTSFPALDAISREYGPRGVTVLAINVDERRRDADAFLASRPHAMAVLFDPKGASAAAFGVKGMPSSFLIDRDGVIRYTHMGYTTTVDAGYRQELAQLLKE